MTNVNPLVVDVSRVKDPSTRQILSYMLKALFDLRNRTGGSVDLGFSNLGDPGADRIVFWDESEDRSGWLEVSTGLSVSGATLVTNDSQINHDNLSGFVSAEHVNHGSVTLTAGNGLTGGGTIESSRSFAVGAGAGITVNANSIETNDSQIVHDDLSGFVPNEHIDHSTVTITAGTNLNGGGDLTTNRTINLDSAISLDSVTADEHITGDNVTAKSGTGNSYNGYFYKTSTGAVYLDAITSGAGSTSFHIRTYNNGTYHDFRFGNDGAFTTDSVRVGTKTPSSASDTGTTGTIAWDSSYLYVCTATDTWKRVAIATW